MTRTVYTVHDGRGRSVPIHNTERAARLSRAGLTVTAVTLEGE